MGDSRAHVVQQAFPIPVVDVIMVTGGFYSDYCHTLVLWFWSLQILRNGMHNIRITSAFSVCRSTLRPTYWKSASVRNMCVTSTVVFVVFGLRRECCLAAFTQE